MKLSLGSAQFGTNYGISNSNGVVTNSEIQRILELANVSGISSIDTAVSYGNSEETLGLCGDLSQFDIVTKSIQFKKKILTKTDADELELEFNKSLSRLKLDSVYGLMIHLPSDLLAQGGEWLFERLCYLRSQNKTKKIGVSIYSPLDVDQVLSKFDIDLIQVPLNIFDQRLIQGGQLTKLKTLGVEVHARSIFLQGLLLMDTKSLPVYFDTIKSKHAKLHQLAMELETTPVKLCVDFLKNSVEIDKIVCGVSSFQEFQELLNCYASDIKGVEIDFEALSVSDLDIIDPSRWV